MSPDHAPLAEAPVAPITLDDLRHKALAIRAEIQDEVEEQVSDRRNQLIAIGVGIGVVVAAVGLAYYFGTRAPRLSDRSLY